MRISIALLLMGSGLLAACHADAPPAAATDPAVLMAADFEQNVGWGDADAASLTTEKAHGGRWSVRVQPDVAFGYTYARLLGDLSPTPLSHLVLEGWVLRPAAGSTAQVVVQVDASATDETRVFYAAFPVAEAVPTLGQWTAVSFPITLPTSATGANKIKVYLWNDKATAPTYLDDVVLREAP